MRVFASIGMRGWWVSVVMSTVVLSCVGLSTSGRAGAVIQDETSSESLFRNRQTAAKIQAHKFIHNAFTQAFINTYTQTRARIHT